MCFHRGCFLLKYFKPFLIKAKMEKSGNTKDRGFPPYYFLVLLLIFQCFIKKNSLL